ncbi:ribosomal protein S6 [Paraphysoderma sedebokerense]|nr:ribosomal protein S6 [Paraphysoderma sedebokerense]
MPLYELVCIARKLDKEPFKQLVKKTALAVMNRGGVVRNLENLGVNNLPYRMKRHQEFFNEGRYFTVRFDASPAIVETVSKEMYHDSRVIRYNVIKIGTKLEDISGVDPAVVGKASRDWVGKVKNQGE